MENNYQAALAAFDHAIANDTAGDAPWIALQTLVREVIGAKLFTVMLSDMKAGLRAAPIRPIRQTIRLPAPSRRIAMNGSTSSTANAAPSSPTRSRTSPRSSPTMS